MPTTTSASHLLLLKRASSSAAATAWTVTATSVRRWYSAAMAVTGSAVLWSANTT